MAILRPFAFVYQHRPPRAQIVPHPRLKMDFKILPIFRGEDEKRTLFGHGFGLFCAWNGRTLRLRFEAEAVIFNSFGLLLVIIVLVGNRVPLVTVVTTYIWILIKAQHSKLLKLIVLDRCQFWRTEKCFKSIFWMYLNILWTYFGRISDDIEDEFWTGMILDSFWFATVWKSHLKKL